MVKEKLRHTLLAVVTAIAVAWSMVSCVDHDDVDSGHTPQTYVYNLRVFGPEASNQLVLDSITSEIASINSTASWLTVTKGTTGPTGHPSLIIESTNGQNEEAIIDVVAENGDRAIVTIKHTPFENRLLASTDDDFIKNWWKYEKVLIQGLGSEYENEPQYTPWTPGGCVNIPEEIRDSYLPKKGWEMAFCSLNDKANQQVRFFGLYNKWTGQLRIFSYLTNTTGWGSDFLLGTKLGQSNSDNLYPYYNALQYSIPTIHKPTYSTDEKYPIMRDAQLVNDQPQPFYTWLAPYDIGKSLSPGWHVFELDMSGYVPDNKDWLEKNVGMFEFIGETSSSQDVTLRGTLTGTLNGSITDQTIKTHGSCNTLAAVSNSFEKIGNVLTGAVANQSQLTGLIKNGYSTNGLTPGLTKMFKVASFAGLGMNAVGAILGIINIGLNDNLSYDTIPGKIDLTLDAQLDLKGQIKQTTSNDFYGYAVAANAIKHANGDNGHLGKGVWGLEEDPVVYIDKDVLLSKYDRCNFSNRGNHTYSQTQIPSYEMRMAYFFDPTSIKVNLNRELFPEADLNISVVTTCGVYTDRETGNTDRYRYMLKLPRDTFSIAAGTKEGGLVQLNGNSTPRIVQAPKEDLLITSVDAYETVDNSTVIEQSGGKGYRFYGYPMELGGKQIMVDPQVYLPYLKKDKTYLFNDPIAPDFVVSVSVVFESQGNTMHYSKTFLPRIVVVDHKTAMEKYEELKTYSNKCINKEFINTLANDPSVKVYHPDGDKFVRKSLRLLEKIK